MIFAAGYGTRLRPFTNDLPKALVPVCGRPMIEHLLDKLYDAGFTLVVVNVHHFADKLESWLKKCDYKGMEIVVSDEREALLDTGGGLLAARPWLGGNEPFLLHNVDILSDVNLKELMMYHQERSSLATLVVKERVSSRYLLFDTCDVLSGWRHEVRRQEIISRANRELVPLAFSGIHVVNPAIFNQITEQGIFSIIDLYLRLSKEDTIGCYRQKSDAVLLDMGKPATLKLAEDNLSSGKAEM